MNARRNVRVCCRFGGVLLVFSTSLLGSAPARAEEPAPAGATPAADPEALGADLFRDAEARYAAGDVAGALDSMQRSYDASGRPELLYNLGELHRELKQCSAAAKAYDDYLARTTQGRHREDAQRNRAALRATCPEDAVPVNMPVIAPPPPDPTLRAAPPAPREPYWTPVRVGAWSAIGAAVALAAGATYAQLRASSEERKVEERLHDRQSADSDITPVLAPYANGSHAATWAAVLGVGAAGLAATGVTLLVLNPGPKQASRAAVTLRLGTSVTLEAVF